MEAEDVADILTKCGREQASIIYQINGGAKPFIDIGYRSGNSLIGRQRRYYIEGDVNQFRKTLANRSIETKVIFVS